MDSIPSQSHGNLITDHDLERFDQLPLPLPLPEMDIDHGALLMQLLDDMPSSTDECEDEQLDFVIRSLEAEIGSDSGLVVVGDDESITGPNDDHDMDSDDGSGLEDIEYDFDKYDDESRTTTMAYYAYHEFDDMDVAAAAAIGPTPTPPAGEQLYVTCEDDQDVQFGEQLGFYNFGTSAYNYSNYVGDHDHQYACVDQQVYSPLWQ